jgi:prephenate dehydratase
LKIATLGPKGTYSEQAALSFANRISPSISNVEIIFTTINNSLRLVQNNQVDYAVVPAENTIDGLIGSTFDALIEFQDFVKVCDEISLTIKHSLGAAPGVNWNNIQLIYSHPSALNQCQNHLEELFPEATLIPLISTAEAADRVLRDQSLTTAAICSPASVQAYGLITYPGEIQDYLFNETRFLACSLTDSAPTGNDRTLLAIRYGENRPGQLYQTAKYLAEAQVDLTFIQSRPYKVKPQEYVLIYEFNGHKSKPEIQVALRNIELQVRNSGGWKKILGSYPKRERKDTNGIVD